MSDNITSMTCTFCHFNRDVHKDKIVFHELSDGNILVSLSENNYGFKSKDDGGSYDCKILGQITSQQYEDFAIRGIDLVFPYLEKHD